MVALRSGILINRPIARLPLGGIISTGGIPPHLIATLNHANRN
jgi:hypothetical protein